MGVGDERPSKNNKMEAHNNGALGFEWGEGRR